MADVNTSQIQSQLDADPTVQAAVQAYNAALKAWSTSSAGQTHKQGPAADDPAVHAAQIAFGNAIKASPLYSQLPKDYQINYDGQVQHIPQFTPNDLALTIGGTLATAGILSGGTGAGGGAGVGAGGESGDAAAEAALAAEGSTGAAAPTTLGAVYGAAPATALPSTAIGSGAVPAITGGAGKVLSTVAGTPNIWSTIISGAGDLIKGIVGSNAAKGAADTQANAALQAAQLNAQAQANSLAFQKQQWADQQANAAPFLKLGQGAANTLSGLMSGGGSAPSTNATPSAPATTLGQVMTPTLAPSLARPAVKLATAPLQTGGARPSGVSGPVSMSSLYGTQAPAADAPQAPPPQAASNPSYVRIKWPDGSSDSIPAGALPQYQLLGAQVNA